MIPPEPPQADANGPDEFCSSGPFALGAGDDGKQATMGRRGTPAAANTWRRFL